MDHNKCNITHFLSMSLILVRVYIVRVHDNMNQMIGKIDFGRHFLYHKLHEKFVDIFSHSSQYLHEICDNSNSSKKKILLIKY